MADAPTPVLSDPILAKEHARSLGSTVVESMPVLPPRADDLPDGVSQDDLIWEETIAAGGYGALMNLHERVLSVLGCQYVDDVLIDAPYDITPEMISRLNISNLPLELFLPFLFL